MHYWLKQVPYLEEKLRFCVFAVFVDRSGVAQSKPKPQSDSELLAGLENGCSHLILTEI